MAAFNNKCKIKLIYKAELIVKIEKPIIIARNFNSLLSNWYISLNGNKVNGNFDSIYRTLRRKTSEYTFFPRTHGIVSNISYAGHKVHLKDFKR